LRWRGQRVCRGHVVWGSGCSTKGPPAHANAT
jgi:hypothetical protein